MKKIYRLPILVLIALMGLPCFHLRAQDGRPSGRHPKFKSTKDSLLWLEMRESFGQKRWYTDEEWDSLERARRGDKPVTPRTRIKGTTKDKGKVYIKHRKIRRKAPIRH